MTQSKRIYAFTAAGEGSQLDELAEAYPLKQTQALVLAIEEVFAWVAKARKMYGDPAPECLQEHSNWLDRVEKLLEELEDAIDDEGDESDALASCRQRADDPWYDAVDEVLGSFPEDNIEFEADALGDYDDLRRAVERLTEFWLENVRRHLRTVLSVMSGDGEVLGMLARYRDHGSIVGFAASR
jgi:hypothetical protein